jgi:putative copper export protein
MIPLVVCRVLHVAAACSSFGGLLYARVIVWPALRRLPPATREPFLASVMRRFSPVKWAGVAVVLLTGIVQWELVRPAVHHPDAYLGWFVLKMAGAVVSSSRRCYWRCPSPPWRECIASARSGRGSTWCSPR